MHLQRLLLAGLTLLVSLQSQAQDTLIVQTFTWASETRAGNFQFPDDPDQTYEKILMRYNMRCHDAAVGSGNVGCREWDYSCNTFLTVPELTDSLRAAHPSHLIPGFSGNAFSYTSQPVYTYTQYTQLPTSVDDPSGVQEHPLGSGEAALHLNDGQGTGKVQLLYRADELIAAGLTAGPVKGLRLETAGPDGMLDFLRIRLKATDQETLTADAPGSGGFTEVFFATADSDPAIFYFHTPFDWDGTANLLVELSFTYPGERPTITASAHDAGYPATVVANGDDRHLAFSGYGAMEIPAETFSQISDEITIALWTYGLPEVMPTNSTLFEGRDGNDNRQVNVHLPWGNGRVYWDCGNDGNDYDRIDQAANSEDFEGQWNHWAFTKNAASGEMKIYLNGQLWHQGTGKFKPIQNVERFLLGTNAAGGSPHFGFTDDLQIWNKALDEATIAGLMHGALTSDHPDFGHLIAYYSMNESGGTTVEDHSANGFHGTLYNSPSRPVMRGKDLYKGFSETALRPNITWLTGDFAVNSELSVVLDSTLNAPRAVLSFAVDDNNDLVATDTSLLWPSGETFVLNEAGEVLETIPVPIEGTVEITTLDYYDKRPAKFELLSFVTPYGNGLDLGPEGKTWFFDVTDYAPILRGERRLSLEMGGQWQEEMDIQFWFITGTPPREVLSIQNIWPFQRGWYADIQSDKVFEPRTLTLDNEGTGFKIRSAVTGHGQNGEFVPRNHYISLEDGLIPFQYQVWKECGDNPVYPQGGTWIFDRAGWCPGMATDVHEFELTDLFFPGQTTIIDYGVQGALLNEANYLVSNQLVTYGPPNFELDAAVVDIVRPTSRVEFERLNPACSNPMVIIKNTGAGDINSLTIEYGMRGGTTQTYQWTGDLYFLETTTVILPVDGLDFYETPLEEKIFEVQVSNPNGATDAYPANNYAAAAMPEVTVFEESALLFQFRTNNRASENRYAVLDGDGNVLVNRQNLANATTYQDELDFPPGCYTLRVFDSGDDGLDFWYWAVVGQNVGTGTLGFRRAINDAVSIPVLTMEPDFGGDIQFDFVIPESNTNADIDQVRRLSVYPNPTPGQLTLELEGFISQDMEITLFSAAGQLQHRERFFHNGGAQNFNFTNLPAGYYVLRLQGKDRVWTKEVVVY